MQSAMAEAGRLGSERGRWILPGLLWGDSERARAELRTAEGVFAHRNPGARCGPEVAEVLPPEDKRGLV
jgi:hypothetical protein